MQCCGTRPDTAINQSKSINQLTLSPHANPRTLVQSAALALPPHVHVDIAVPAVLAVVDGLARDRSTEKSLATLAGERVVVIAGRLGVR